MIFGVLAVIGFLFTLLTGTFHLVVWFVLILGIIAFLGPFVLHLGLVLLVVFLILGFIKFLCE